MDELKDKAVDIKGKQYILVSDRVLYFNANYSTGSITTELLSKPEDSRVVVKATVTLPQAEPNHVSICAISKHIRGENTAGAECPDCTCGARPLPTKRFTGHSQAVVGEGMVNKTAALENAETSAVGRALGFMGIGVIESIASADEMVKAKPKSVVEAKGDTKSASIADVMGEPFGTLDGELNDGFSL